MGNIGSIPYSSTTFSEDAFLLRYDAATLQKLIPSLRRNIRFLSPKLDCVQEDSLFLVTPLLRVRQVLCSNHNLGAGYPDFA